MAENLGLSRISLADGKACRMCIWLSFKITHEYKSLVGKIEKRKRKGERERDGDGDWREKIEIV